MTGIFTKFARKRRENQIKYGTINAEPTTESVAARPPVAVKPRATAPSKAVTAELIPSVTPTPSTGNKGVDKQYHRGVSQTHLKSEGFESPDETRFTQATVPLTSQAVTLPTSLAVPPTSLAVPASTTQPVAFQEWVSETDDIGSMLVKMSFDYVETLRVDESPYYKLYWMSADIGTNYHALTRQGTLQKIALELGFSPEFEVYHEITRLQNRPCVLIGFPKEHKTVVSFAQFVASVPEGKMGLCQRIDCSIYARDFKDLPHTFYGGASGSGKCHALNTPILMYNGQVKKVQDIVVGDQLMGPDSTPRKVLSLATGREEIIQVIPDRGDAWGGNRSHVLSLRNSHPDLDALLPDGRVARAGGGIINLSIHDYLKAPSEFKTLTQLYRSEAIHFHHYQDEPDFDSPYTLGAWLIHNTFADKRIPLPALVCSTICRLKILAGILDTVDGGVNSSGEFVIRLSAKDLLKDLLFLCRSLGFSAYTNTSTRHHDSTVYSVWLSGDLSRIPTQHLVLHNSPMNSTMSHTLDEAFTLESQGEGDYYGFTLDGDHLYCLGDFTVTHNTTACYTDVAQYIGFYDPEIFVIDMKDSEEDWGDVRACLPNTHHAGTFSASINLLNLVVERMYQSDRRILLIIDEFEKLMSDENVATSSEANDHHYPTKEQHLEIRRILALLATTSRSLGVRMVCIGQGENRSKIGKKIRGQFQMTVGLWVAEHTASQAITGLPQQYLNKLSGEGDMKIYLRNRTVRGNSPLALQSDVVAAILQSQSHLQGQQANSLPYQPRRLDSLEHPPIK